MTHLWNVLMIPAIHFAGARYLLTVHDATPHPGERVPGRGLMLAREISGADGIIALTEYVRQRAILLHGRDIPSWSIPLGSLGFSPNREARTLDRSRRVRLLFFGRILPYKGLDLLFEAFQLMLSRGLDAELSVVGDGRLPPIPPGIATLVKVDNRWITDDEVNTVLANADVLVLPYSEASQSGSASAAFEAGLPVVATPVGGLVEQIQHRGPGVVASSISSEGIAEALITLLSEPGLYEHCSATALRLARSTLGWNAIGPQLAAAIRRVAESGVAPPVTGSTQEV